MKTKKSDKIKDIKMTEKQKKFADEYIITLNATGSALKAGYSKKTARAIASENLTKPNIKEYIRLRASKLEDERTADMKEVSEFVTNIMRSTGEETKDRLKAADMLIKTKGGYLEKVEHSGTVGIKKDYSKMTTEELELELLKNGNNTE